MKDQIHLVQDPIFEVEKCRNFVLADMRLSALCSRSHPKLG